MDRRVRIGVIGLGYWGPNLARNIAELPTAELVAVSDLKQERLDRIVARYPRVVTTTNYSDLFEMELDAVVIATPPHTHYNIAKSCLEHDLHIMVEKPLTLNTRDGQALVDLGRQRNRHIMVGHTFIYNMAVREIRRIIEDGELGNIYYIDAVRANLGLYQLGTDVMWDLAPHDMSIINYLLGTTPVSVSAQGGKFVLRDYNLHDVVYLHMHYPDNVIANLRLSWLDPDKTRRITVVGSRKMLVFDDLQPVEKIRIYDKRVETPPYTENFSEFQASYRTGDVIIPHIAWIEPLHFECKHFVECIRENWTPQTDGLAGLNVVSILEAAAESLNAGDARIVPVYQAVMPSAAVSVNGTHTSL